MIEQPQPDEVASIAVLRANALGDYLVAEPALSALRAWAPQARITLVGTQLQADLLAGRPAPVDEVVVAPLTQGVNDPGARRPAGQAETEAFFRRMRARRFDLALQLHGGGRFSNPFLRALGAAHTVGLRAADAPPLDQDLPYQFWQHEVHRYLDVVALLGAPPVHVVPQFAVVPGDRQAAQPHLDWLDGRPLTVIHPAASDPRRRWPAERFAAVGRALHHAGAAVAVLGSAAEQPLADEVAGAIPGARNLAGQLSLPALVGVLAQAVLLVGNDSGPRHLADAVGTATVSVYWCGNVITAGPVSRAGHRVHISWTTSCPVCGEVCVGEPFPPRCSHDPSFVTDVDVSAVTTSVLQAYVEAVVGARN